jgi:hypothetical protein
MMRHFERNCQEKFAADVKTGRRHLYVVFIVIIEEKLKKSPQRRGARGVP